MFKAFRRYYWISQGFLSKHARTIFNTTILVLGGLSLIFFFIRYIPTPKQTVRIGRIGKYSIENIPTDIQLLVSRGLVSIEPGGKVTGALAKSWEIKDDGKTYHFKLNDEINWHDNSPILSSDITYNFKNVEITREGDTITYHLEEPFSPFLSIVSKPVLKQNKYGIGEYHLIKSKINSGVLQSIILENEQERRIYKFFPTETSALLAYKLGEIDTVEQLSFVPKELQADPSNLISEDKITNPEQSVIFFNNNDVLLVSKSARQGLAYALKDKSFGRERSISPIDKDSWAYNSLVKTYDFDSEKAKSLFAQDIKDPSSQKLELKTTLQYLDIAEKIAESWREVLGVKVDVKVVSTVTTDYQILLADFNSPIDPDQYTLWHSTQPTNVTHYSNLKVDKLLEDGRRTLDQKIRKEIYQDFQRFLLEDCPAIFLFQSNSYSITRNQIRL